MAKLIWLFYFIHLVLFFLNCDAAAQEEVHGASPQSSSLSSPIFPNKSAIPLPPPPPPPPPFPSSSSSPTKSTSESGAFYGRGSVNPPASVESKDTFFVKKDSKTPPSKPTKSGFTKLREAISQKMRIRRSSSPTKDKEKILEDGHGEIDDSTPSNPLRARSPASPRGSSKVRMEEAANWGSPLKTAPASPLSSQSSSRSSLEQLTIDRSHSVKVRPLRKKEISISLKKRKDTESGRSSKVSPRRAKSTSRSTRAGSYRRPRASKSPQASARRGKNAVGRKRAAYGNAICAHRIACPHCCKTVVIKGQARLSTGRPNKTPKWRSASSTRSRSRSGSPVSRQRFRGRKVGRSRMRSVRNRRSTPYSPTRSRRSKSSKKSKYESSSMSDLESTSQI